MHCRVVRLLQISDFLLRDLYCLTVYRSFLCTAAACIFAVWAWTSWPHVRAQDSELRFGESLREVRLEPAVELESLTVERGTYDVDQAIATRNLAATQLVVNGSLRIDGGTFRMGRKPLRVTGTFTLDRDATFIPGSAPLIFNDTATIHVTPRTRTIIIPAAYGPLYSQTGAVLYGTGELITATGSRTETYTPSLGHVIIQ